MTEAAILVFVEDRAWASAFSAGVRDVPIEITSSDDGAAALARLEASAVGVVGCGSAGDGAVVAAAADARVSALAVVDAPLSEDAVGLIGEWPQIPFLAVADPGNRAALASAVDAYLAAAHRGSRLVAKPTEPATAATVAEWMEQRLTRRPRVDDIVIETAEGWRLHATRWLPVSDHPVPGVLLLHTGRSDRAAFARLERLLADRGFAVLNLDWRGRGQSTNKGTYFDLSVEERAAAWQDAVAALDHLGQSAEVDSGRLAAVGVVHGAEYAVRAALRDERVKALVLLTGYRPADESEAAHLTSGKVEVLYVTSTAHTITTDAMRSLYEASPGRHTRYVEYPGAAIGYQLFEADDDLEPDVVEWLAEVLPP